MNASATAQSQAVNIAKCLVKIANENQEPINVDENDTPVFEGITHLKLQKLVYFAQVVSVVLNKKPLFDEEIQAWKYGPVIESVYQVFQAAGREPIPTDENFNVDADTEKFLKEIWKAFGKYSASELVSLSHSKPWQKARDAGTTIDIGEIKAHYAPIFSVTKDGQA